MNTESVITPKVRRAIPVGPTKPNKNHDILIMVEPATRDYPERRTEVLVRSLGAKYITVSPLNNDTPRTRTRFDATDWTGANTSSGFNSDATLWHPHDPEEIDRFVSRITRLRELGWMTCGSNHVGFNPDMLVPDQQTEKMLASILKRGMTIEKLDAMIDLLEGE